MAFSNSFCTGATRLVFIVGDPISQVKSPQWVTPRLRELGADMIVVPVQVKPAYLIDFMLTSERMTNVEGMIVTVPHKFSALQQCREISPRARDIGAVNLMKRSPGGGWYGDMQDGVGHVLALRRRGFEPLNKRVLVVGAGGAGSAIALALSVAGASTIAVHDLDPDRRNELLQKLMNQRAASPEIGSANPEGFDLVVNATTMGMNPEDPLPIDIQQLSVSTFVSDVVTVPASPPLIEAARRRGCPTLTGCEMFETMRDLIVDFYIDTKHPNADLNKTPKILNSPLSLEQRPIA
jgi:shikimate dehydrogenase